MNKRLFSFIASYSGWGLIMSFLVYVPLSWLVVFRDGRAVYTTLHFYPQFTPYFKAIEPHLVAYGINSIPTILLFLFILISFSLYMLSLKHKFTLKKVIIFACMLQCITFFSYPSLSTDIFSYIFSDRIATVYHQNVWKTKPITHKDDPFIQLSDWQNNTRVYGGTNQAIYSVASVFGGNNLLLLVMLYKAIAWIFTLATMWIVYLITKKHFTGKEAIFIQGLFWNPLFVIEILGSGHNDILMIFFMLTGYYMILQKRFIFSAIIFALAVQVKIIAGVLFLFVVLDMLRKKQFRSVSILLLIFGLVNAVMFSFMGIDPISFAKAIAFNTGVYWQGFPSLVHTFFPAENLIVAPGILLSFGVFIYLILKKHVDSLTAYSGFILVYLLFFASAYWNWYVLWAFCFFPFISSKKLQLSLLTLTGTSLLLYPFYWITLRFDHTLVIWPILTYFLLAALPIIVFFIPQKYRDYLLNI